MKTTHLNEHRLTPNTRSGDVEIIAWGDVHFGHPNCNVDKAKGYLEYCLKNKQYVIGMGDYIEAVTVGSKGYIFEQVCSPEAQTETITEWLRPLAEAGLLLGLHRGNHSQRVMNTTSFDPVAIMCKELKCRHLGDATFNIFKVGKQTYRVKSAHGRSSARLPQTKLLACRNMTNVATADLYLMGHMHTLETSASIYFDVDLRSGKLVQRTRHYCITGSFLEYLGSYAEANCMIPSRTGSPRITFEAEHHDIHVSL